MHVAGAALSTGNGYVPNPNAGAGRICLIIGLVLLAALVTGFLIAACLLTCSRAFCAKGLPALPVILCGLFSTTLLLLTRNIFRVCEFSQGPGLYGYLARHEAFFYGFDALMVLTWLVLMVPLHFGLHMGRLERQLAQQLTQRHCKSDLMETCQLEQTFAAAGLRACCQV